MAEKIHIVFDGPPSHKSGRFVEVENASGQSIRFGEWVHRPDGFWALVIAMPETFEEHKDALHDLVMLRAQDEIGCVPPPTKDQWAKAWPAAGELFDGG